MAGKAMVETHDLTKVYSDGVEVRAVDGVTLSIGAGEFVALTGPSGSGKTTLLNLIGTLDVPTAGRVVVDGVDVGTLRGDRLADFRREKIGFVFQFFNLVPTLTALENVMLPLLPYRRWCRFDLKARARELLQALGLEGRMYHLPGQLSGGEQQRVAIARALVNEPLLILADEPTGNLDSRATEEILALLQRLNTERGITLVVATHNPRVAAAAGRVVELRDGRILGG
ncbi:MAG: ABC transporter ATP-binding protein [Anaerolineae bacterium]|nr:ABC transporter ATP-binding protein [Anaerolineae bacterium]